MTSTFDLGAPAQRLCLAPDADLFLAIRAGPLETVTDRIDTFTETGLRPASGTDVPTDVIVTATVAATTEPPAGSSGVPLQSNK
nr:hypothetical protein GCM10017611_00420 [Rhodococcus wratislaviensis]